MALIKSYVVQGAVTIHFFPGTLLSLHIFLEKWFSVAKIKEIHSENCLVESEPIPIEAMYGIFTCIFTIKIN